MAEDIPNHPIISGYELFRKAPTYAAGHHFIWKLDDGWDRNVFFYQDLTIHVLNPILPFTCSPVMRVRFDTRQGPQIAILKTYDRREGWASRRVPRPRGHRGGGVAKEKKQRRRILVHEPHSDELYAELVQKNRVPKLWSYFQRGMYVPQNRSAIMECYFQYLRETEFASECRAYERMFRYQGLIIPRFLASMSWRPDCPHSQYLTIRAILIQEIAGAVTVEKFFSNPNVVVPHVLRVLIEDRIEWTKSLMRAAGVDDVDRHHRNSLILVHNAWHVEFSIFQIDFGYSVVRHPPSGRIVIRAPLRVVWAGEEGVVAGAQANHVSVQVEADKTNMLPDEGERRNVVAPRKQRNRSPPDGSSLT